jgi:flagellar basal-body rod protein FlgC
MSIDAIVDAARAGLSYERLRLDAATRNIAAANVPLAPDAVATRTAVGPGAFDAHLGEGVMQQPVATRAVHDPGHPLADADGIVRYPATDLVTEMTTLMTASRGYEANVRSFNLLRGMVMKALELGGK